MIISDISNLTHGSEKRVKLKCNGCAIISETNYHNYSTGQKKRGFDGKTYCHKCTARINAKKRVGKRTTSFGRKYTTDKLGPNNPRFKTGTYIGSDGYRIIWIGPHGSKTDTKWDLYRKEHFVVIEKVIGRKLKKGEVIHHIDGDKLNNNIDNLILCDSEKEHQKLHKSLRLISYELIRNGTIKFNKSTREYFI
jgi:hypothetical protein